MLSASIPPEPGALPLDPFSLQSRATARHKFRTPLSETLATICILMVFDRKSTVKMTTWGLW